MVLQYITVRFQLGANGGYPFVTSSLPILLMSGLLPIIEGEAASKVISDLLLSTRWCQCQMLLPWLFMVCARTP